MTCFWDQLKLKYKKLNWKNILIDCSTNTCATALITLSLFKNLNPIFYLNSEDGCILLLFSCLFLQLRIDRSSQWEVFFCTLLFKNFEKHLKSNAVLVKLQLETSKIISNEFIFKWFQTFLITIIEQLHCRATSFRTSVFAKHISIATSL